MADGIININNQILNEFNSKAQINSFNKNDVLNFRNINKLDDFVSSLDNSESSNMLKGAVSKIQQGQNLQATDFAGMTGADIQFAKDLEAVTGGASSQTIHSPGEVADKFSNLLDKYLNNVSADHKNAEKAVETFASGGDIDIHSVMIASEKANLSMQLALQMRNKIVQAYKEISNIRV